MAENLVLLDNLPEIAPSRFYGAKSKKHHYTRPTMLTERQSMNTHHFRVCTKKPFEEANANFAGSNNVPYFHGLINGSDNKLDTLILNTDSASVLEFSIRSQRKKPYDSCIQSLKKIQSSVKVESINWLQLAHEVELITGNIVLEEAKLRDPLKLLGVYVIPGIIGIKRILDKCMLTNPQPVGVLEAMKLSHVLEKALNLVWVSKLQEYTKQLEHTANTLNKIPKNYLKTGKDASLNLPIQITCQEIRTRWQQLKYFPSITVDSLSLAYNESSGYSDYENNSFLEKALCRILLVTLAIEVNKLSRSSIKLMTLVGGFDEFNDFMIINTVDGLLRFTVESKTGELLIGMDELLQQWVQLRWRQNPFIANMIHDWALSLHNEWDKSHNGDTLRVGLDWDAGPTTVREALEQEAEYCDLEFNKWDVVKPFVVEVLDYCKRHCQSIQENMSLFVDSASDAHRTMSTGVSPCMGKNNSLNYFTANGRRAHVCGWLAKIRAKCKAKLRDLSGQPVVVLSYTKWDQ